MSGLYFISDAAASAEITMLYGVSYVDLPVEFEEKYLFLFLSISLN